MADELELELDYEEEEEERGDLGPVTNGNVNAQAERAGAHTRNERTTSSSEEEREYYRRGEGPGDRSEKDSGGDQKRHQNSREGYVYWNGAQIGRSRPSRPPHHHRHPPPPPPGQRPPPPPAPPHVGGRGYRVPAGMDAYHDPSMMMMMDPGNPMGWHGGYRPPRKRKKMEYVRPDTEKDMGKNPDTDEEKKEKKLAAIRAMREEQAAKNKALAEKRKEKIEHMNALQERKRKIVEEKKKRMEELRLKRDALLAAKEAEVQELRQQLAEKKKT